MTMRCPFSDPQDPVSRVSKIKGQGPRSAQSGRQSQEDLPKSPLGGQRPHFPNNLRPAAEASEGPNSAKKGLMTCQNERHFSVKISPVTPTPYIMRTNKSAGQRLSAPSVRAGGPANRRRQPYLDLGRDLFARQEPFTAGSRIATHSTWWVIEKVSAWAIQRKEQVRPHLSAHCPACGHTQSVKRASWRTAVPSGSGQSTLRQPARVRVGFTE